MLHRFSEIYVCTKPWQCSSEEAVHIFRRNFAFWSAAKLCRNTCWNSILNKDAAHIKHRMGSFVVATPYSAMPVRCDVLMPVGIASYIMLYILSVRRALISSEDV